MKIYNQKSKILHRLINNESVSEQDFKMNGFRARLSELRSLIPIMSKRVEFVNEFGNPGTYNEYYLDPNDKEKAIEVFNRINKK